MLLCVALHFFCTSILVCTSHSCPNHFYNTPMLFNQICDLSTFLGTTYCILPLLNYCFYFISVSTFWLHLFIVILSGMPFSLGQQCLSYFILTLQNFLIPEVQRKCRAGCTHRRDTVEVLYSWNHSTLTDWAEDILMDRMC